MLGLIEVIVKNANVGKSRRKAQLSKGTLLSVVLYKHNRFYLSDFTVKKRFYTKASSLYQLQIIEGILNLTEVFFIHPNMQLFKMLIDVLDEVRNNKLEEFREKLLLLLTEFHAFDLKLLRCNVCQKTFLEGETNLRISLCKECLLKTNSNFQYSFLIDLTDYEGISRFLRDLYLLYVGNLDFSDKVESLL